MVAGDARASRGPLPTEARPVWRLILDGAADGAWNMAVDEALLERYAAADGPATDRPTLRLYGWAPSALSLGRHQPAAGAHDPDWLRREAVDLVRRPTGGRAVLHEGERTYAMIGRADRPPFDGTILETYAAIASALVDAFAALGVPTRACGGSGPDPGPRSGHPSCFADAGRHEIETADGRKLVGSAQLRRGRALLQHGSIPLRRDPARVARAIGVASHGGSTDLASVAGEPPAPAALDVALVRGFERRFGVALEPEPLGEREELLAQRLRCWRYDSASWTLEGRRGAREARYGPRLDWDPAG